MKGKVYIIGAGPGDFGLLTIKAKDSIGKADVIVYDRLINHKILSLAKKDAEFINVGKMPDRHAVPQDKINNILVTKAQEGKIVARVKGGDPFVFGRGGEEALELSANNVPYEIIPGVTSSIAVPAYAGIPVTHRDFCSSFHVITGHERHDMGESALDYSTLAKLSGTLIFLMGVKNLDNIVQSLLINGKDPETPCAIVENGTSQRQRVITGVLKDINSKAEKEKIKNPAITVIGKVAELSERLKWFPRGKLAGKRILVTRSRIQASRLVQNIEELGGEALEYPVISIEPAKDWMRFDHALENIKSYQWLVFTSPNGVRIFFDRLKEIKKDIRCLHGIKLCAVGAETASALEGKGLLVDYIPERFTTEQLKKGMLGLVKKGERILMARSDIANKELSKDLADFGAIVEDLEVYRTIPDNGFKADIINLLKENEVDYITFTSSSTVRFFMEMLGTENLAYINKCKIACIGPVTEAEAVNHGLNVWKTAKIHTIDGLLEILE